MKLYEACSYEDNYAELLASSIAGETELVYEQFLTHGQKCIGVTPSRRTNPKIEYSARKFGMILKDYSNWQTAWWREVIQNSVDAGANKVYLNAYTASLEKIEEYAGYATLPSIAQLGPIDITDCAVVSCSDNAGGMDERTLFDKFLTLGATGKEGEGAVGGFGIAKELILLPWIVWTVHTRNKKVVGRGLDYEVLDVPYRDGTLVEVIMPKDNYTPHYKAIDVISKSNIPNVEFVVNGESREAELKGAKLVNTLPGNLARIYHKPSGGSYHILVRVAGPKGSLFMFPVWSGIELPGTFLAEIDGSKSTEYLSTNRDGFSEEGKVVERAIQAIVTKASKDVLSFSRLFNARMSKFYDADPEQRLIARQTQADAIAQLEPIDTLSDEGVINISLKISQIIEQEAEADISVAGNYQVEAADRATIIDVLSNAVTQGQTSFETAAKQLVWKPDFAVVSEIDGYIPPADFFLETMSAKAAKLIKVWTELCRFVLISLNYAGPFGVGYIFSKKAGAAYQPKPDSDDLPGYLMLNPFKKPGIQRHPVKDLDWLWAAAIHECTHMVDGIEEHDEAFAAALTDNIARTRRYFKLAKKIAGGVKKVEGLSAAEAKRESKALQQRVERERREQIMQGIQATGIVPRHEFVFATRGRPAKELGNRKCQLCGRKYSQHD